ncbi:hypothetical protein K438DRAFT_1978940 [Mycena galopus ATCC 62051]|nr:hypothetical protein K438DRAFT_1978940 [Mycena galopus ATCC 62051]
MPRVSPSPSRGPEEWACWMCVPGKHAPFGTTLRVHLGAPGQQRRTEPGPIANDLKDERKQSVSVDDDIASTQPHNARAYAALSAHNPGTPHFCFPFVLSTFASTPHTPQTPSPSPSPCTPSPLRPLDYVGRPLDLALDVRGAGERERWVRSGGLGENDAIDAALPRTDAAPTRIDAAVAVY